MSFASEKLIDNPNSSRVSNAEIQEPFMIISATLHTLFSADAEGHFGFYYFMRKSGSLRACRYGSSAEVKAAGEQSAAFLLAVL